MSFEESYRKYEDGTATPEERKYVEEEIAKARALTAILDKADAAREDVIGRADRDKVKRARRSFGKRLTVKIVILSLACLLVLSALTVGILYGTAVSAARRSAEYDLTDAGELAKKCVVDHVDGVAVSCTVTETDRDLRYGSKLSQSYFVYEIEVVCGQTQYEVEVNASTGYARITDVD